MTVAAVVLAAGVGSRFASGHKLDAAFRGKPLVQWAIEHALAAQLDETLVITGACKIDMPAGAREVHHADFGLGQASSLQAALCAAQSHDAIVVGLGDQPMIDPAAWRLVAAAQGAICAAVYDGVQGNPVRLDRSIWSLLPTHGDAGARTVMRANPELVVTVPCPGNPADIDTLEDLRRWN